MQKKKKNGEKVLCFEITASELVALNCPYEADIASHWQSMY